MVNVLAELAKFADAQKAQPTLAFTHFQPAQPTTVGKRATLWMNELVVDLEDLDYVIPGNDDAIRAVKLIVGKMADAIIEANQGEIMSDVEAESAEADAEEAEA